MDFQGIKIRIEYKKGETKPDEDIFTDDLVYGWSMYADYGYIEETIGADGEEIDVFVGPRKDSEEVFIATLMRYNDEDGQPEFDEWKVALGFADYEEAKKFFDLQYGMWRIGVIYRSSIQDIRELREISQFKFRKEILYIEEQEAEQPALVVETGQEIGQYGQPGDKQDLIIEL